MNEQEQLFFKNLQQGENKTLEQFMEKHIQKVTNHVLKNNGKREDAEDLMQDCMMELANSISKATFSFESISKLDAYFMKIIRNSWTDRLRKQKNKPYMVSFENQKIEVSDTDNSLNALELEELWEKVFGQEMAQMSVFCQVCIKARILFGMSYKEIFETYQDEKLHKIELVKSRLQDCKKQFRKKVENNPLYKKLINHGS